MKIPMGNFGNVVAEPQRQAQVRNTGGAIAQGVSDIGQALGGIGKDMQQAELQKQRSEAAMTAAQLSNDLHDVHDQIGRDVTAGAMPADQAVPEFQKRMGEISGERMKSLTNDQRMVIDEHLVRSGGTLTRNLQGVALKRTQADTGANLLGMGEQFQRAAMRDLPGAVKQWDQAVDTMGPAAGWGPEQIAKAKQGFVEGATFNFANATLEGAAQTGDIELVRAARAKIEGKDGEPIDPARRTALITKAYGIENGIVASGIRDQEKQKREAEARENKAGDVFKSYQSLVLEGRYLSTDAINELSTVTAGTSYAPAVQELVKAQAQVAGFAALPLQDQSAQIEQLRAAGSTRGVGTNPDREKLIGQLERIRDSGQKAYAENPWTAAQERGVVQRAPEVQLTDMASAQAVLGERMKEIGTVEAAAGRKISPLQPQEAETIGKLVRTMPPDQQSAALATFGKVINDPERLTDFARQIDAKDRVLGTAMMVGDLQTTQGRYVSELVLKGARAMKDKTISVDSAKETGWRAEIANEVGDAFPNQEVRERMIEAAFMVQAGFAAEGGGPDYKRALRLVAGEIVEHNGAKIPLPRAMDESTFEKRLTAIQPAALAAQAPGGQVYVGKTPVPLDQFVKSLGDAALVSAGPGKYNVRAGMGLVTNSKGKRITIEVGNGN
jgi:hypothetical protein